MTSPTFKKVTNTTTDPSNVRYGAPDLVYVMDVLDGTHATDRIQSSVIEHNRNTYGAIVYQLEGFTYARRISDGVIISSSNTTPETVITAAINDQSPGSVYIADGVYDLTSGFTGFKLDYAFTRITMAKDAKLRVPSAYAGAIFLMNTVRDATGGYINGTTSPLLPFVPLGYTQVIIEGGILEDQGASTTQARSWTGIRMYASRSGTFLNTIRDININHCSTGIELLMDDATPDATGQRHETWANVNLFDNIWINDFVIGIDFKVHANVTPTGGGGFSRNVFKHVVMQAGSGSSPRTTPSHGIKDIRHGSNAFHDCISYDFQSPALRSTIHSTAEDTLIIGGALTDSTTGSGSLWVDSGTDTRVLDEWNNLYRDGLTMSRFGSSPSLMGQRTNGTQVSPTVVTSGETLFAIRGGGYNGSSYPAVGGSGLEFRSSGAWSGSANGGFVNFYTTLEGTTSAVSRMRLHNNGDLALGALAKLFFDGIGGSTGAGGNTYIHESAADTIQVVSGGTVAFEARSAHALTKGFEGTADPTTTDVPAGYFTVGERTDTGDVKLWYNDGGTLKSVALT